MVVVRIEVDEKIPRSKGTKERLTQLFIIDDELNKLSP